MPPAPDVSAATVLVKQISQWDDFSGRVEAVENVDLRPRVSGYIDRVNYEEGQEVRKGDVLFTIDSRSYRAELARAQADLARARSQAELGRSEAARAKKLSDLQAISTESYEQRRSAGARQTAQRSADRRLREVQAIRRFGDALCLGDDHEDAQEVEVEISLITGVHDSHTYYSLDFMV